MKPLTVEEKAKLYDEAIEVIRKCETDKYGCVIGIKPSDIFPELKEGEDEKIVASLIGHLKACRKNTRSEVMLDEYAKWIAWLEQILANSTKTCKDEHKPAWSEEDENTMNKLLSLLLANHPDVWAMFGHWLKSLKERCTWEPTDEQMDALYTYIYNPQYIDNSEDERIKLVISLYEQLKKLKGE